MPVVPLKSDTRLRYLDWVSSKRAQVRELSGGRLGYLHVPDMVGEGWADFSRDLRREMVRDALIVDVRGNTGGHTSQLVVEKLARRVMGWDVRRGMKPSTYPEDAPRGPVVALTDECSGSTGALSPVPSACSSLAPWSAPGPGAASSVTTTCTSWSTERRSPCRSSPSGSTSTAGARRTTASTLTSRSSCRPTTGRRGGAGHSAGDRGQARAGSPAAAARGAAS